MGSRPPTPRVDKAEWHVSINDVPIGPIRLEEMAHKVDAGAVSEYSLVWRDGFDEWRPLATVPELMSLLYQRRSSGPPTRSRFSSMPPFVEAQTAIKETPEPPSVPPAAPKPPVHALGDTMGPDTAAGFLPLADALQPESSLPGELGALGVMPSAQPPSVQPAVVFEPDPIEPDVESSAPSGAFSGLPQPPEEEGSVPVAPPTQAVEPAPRKSSAWIWVMMVAVAAFAGVAAVLVVDRWGDTIMERVLGSESAIPEPAGRGAPSNLAEAGDSQSDSTVAGETVDGDSEDQVGEALGSEMVGSDEDPASINAAEAEDATATEVSSDAGEGATEAGEGATEADAVDPVEAKPAQPATPPPAKPRKRARRRPAKPAAASSTGIKKLGDDALSAEEQRLLDDFGSSNNAGVAKIDVKDASSAKSNRAPLDSKAVSSTVTVNKPRLQRCYERAIRGQQSPTAVRMNVSLTVAPSGRASAVEVFGSGPGGLKECMESSIRRWRFPASSEGGPAKFPIVFSAN